MALMLRATSVNLNKLGVSGSYLIYLSFSDYVEIRYSSSSLVSEIIYFHDDAF